MAVQAPTRPQRPTRERRPRRRWIRALLRAFVAVVVLVAVGVAGAWVVTPSVGDAPSRVREMATRTGARDVAAPVPPRFAESIVASEDSRFYSEPGIDPIGMLRAAWLGLTASHVDGGGSTLAQQLAKQLYTNGHGGLLADAEQVTLAMKLSATYSKERILRMYAGTVYFGHGYSGLANASCGYFGVPASQMTLAQASMLAGLVQAPSAYDPLAHLHLAKARQHYVIGRLAATGKISEAQARRTFAAPLHLTGGSATCG